MLGCGDRGAAAILHRCGDRQPDKICQIWQCHKGLRAARSDLSDLVMLNCTHPTFFQSTIGTSHVQNVHCNRIGNHRFQHCSLNMCRNPSNSKQYLLVHISVQAHEWHAPSDPRRASPNNLRRHMFVQDLKAHPSCWLHSLFSLHTRNDHQDYSTPLCAIRVRKAGYRPVK